jgi:hypothetical protein
MYQREEESMNDNEDIEDGDFEELPANTDEAQAQLEVVHSAIKFYEAVRAAIDPDQVNAMLSRFHDVCQDQHRANIYCALCAAIVNISKDVPNPRAVGPMIQMLIQDIFQMKTDEPRKH